MEATIIRGQAGAFGYNIVYDVDKEFNKMLKHKKELDKVIQDIIDDRTAIRKTNKKISKNLIIKRVLKQKNVNATDKKSLDWKH